MNEYDFLIPVEDQTGLCRDPKSGAIVNVDTTEYDKYMANYEANQKRKKELQNLRNDVNMLQSDVSDIKNLLVELLRRTDDGN
jgi:hypothetical protein